MPTYLQRVYSGRITKPSASTSSPTLNRSFSSPLTTAKLSNPGISTLKRSQTVALYLNGNHRDDETDRPGSRGPISLLPHARAQDATSAITDALTSMFDELPDRSGLNSVGISNVLNFRRRLPKVVTASHVHALTRSASQTEREIQSLLARGKLVKLSLIGRGNDVSGLGEVLVRREDYYSLLLENGVERGTADTFIQSVTATSKAIAPPIQALNRAQINSLMRSGFLVSSGFSSLKADTLSPTRCNTSTITTATISKAAAGTQDAVGGSAAFEILGGNGTFRHSSSTDSSNNQSTLPLTNLMLSAPGLAAYLQLLTTARVHLLALLRKSGGVHQQMPLTLLRERWNGNVEDESSQSVHRRLRGEFTGVLPARTKKWKMMYGLRFEWVLEECLGAGMVECWHTGAVGLGVRALV